MARNSLTRRVAFWLPPAPFASRTSRGRAALPNPPSSQAGLGEQHRALSPHLAGIAPLWCSALRRDAGKAPASKPCLSFGGEGSGDESDTRRSN